MIESNIEDGGNPGPGPGLVMERAKLRTISCSTEESGVDSMSTVSCSSLPSVSECSSPNTVSAHSEPESDTSDYPRNTPSPASRRPHGGRARPGGLNEVQRAVLPRRRAPALPLSGKKNKNLPGEEPGGEPGGGGEQSKKKIRLESSSGGEVQPSPPLCTAADCKCNVKALPKNNKSECESQKCVGGHFTANHVKTETDEMKMEIAKIDNILQGKLLLEKSSHKLCDMVGLDKLKQEYESSDDKKKIQLSHIKHDKSCKVEREEVHSSSNSSNNNNNKNDKDFQLSKLPEEEEEEEGVRCKWSGCGARLEVQNLLDHLSTVHVRSQKGEEGGKYRCLWVGCKVYSAPSTSFSWLCNHVTSHVGKKPFICMVDGCTQRFGSQLSLSRHVNSHFKNPSCPPANSQPRKSAPASPIKFYIRKNRRKLKPTVCHQSSKPELFHIGIMAGIKDGLSRISTGQGGGEAAAPQQQQITFDQTGNDIIFHQKIKSRKLDENGNIHYLVSWLPEGMFPEQWVTKKNLKPSRRRVSLSQVSPAIKEKVENFIFGQKLPGKHPRKPALHCGPSKLT